jgi:SAM-dependent methyltransferase
MSRFEKLPRLEFERKMQKLAMAIKNSYRAWRRIQLARGRLLYRVRLWLVYTRNVTIFDFWNGVNTSFVTESHLLSRSELVAQDVPYMPAFTKTLQNAYETLEEIRPQAFSYHFIDIGCGAGKALMSWKIMNETHGRLQSITGIEIDGKLVATAKENLSQIKLSSEIKLLQIDTLSDGLTDEIQSGSILFLYNPFGLSAVRIFLSRIRKIENLIVIYVNPEHREEFQRNGFVALVDYRDWHPALNFTILENAPHFT